MSDRRTYNVLSLFCGSGGKTLGVLRARGREADGGRSRFVSCGAFDLNAEAVEDFEMLTGATATVADIAEMSPASLASMCSGRPDLAIMSPPCKGWSGCLPEAMSRSPKYTALNDLALYSLDLVLEAWATPPAVILLENVPRMLTRGKAVIEQAKALLRAKGYEVDLREHDCGILGGLAQSRKRVLVVARLTALAPTPLLMPDPKPLRSMASVLWQLPVPTPGSSMGGAMHRLPQLSALNWVRLAAIRASNDWRDLPKAIRLPGDERRHAGKYGVQDPDSASHTVISEARTGKGWCDIADPRIAFDTSSLHSGLYGVCDVDGPSHTIISQARPGNASWASAADPRLRGRAARQNGGFGVNDPDLAAHSVLGEGSVRNTFASTADPRLGCSPHTGTMGVSDAAASSSTVLASADIHNSPVAVADPRSDCKRREGALGVNASSSHLYTAVIANAEPHNGPWQIADPRVPEQFRGAYGVRDPAAPSATIRASHCVRTAPASVADDRGFEPTHALIAGQALGVGRDAWVDGVFELRGPQADLARKGRPVHLIIAAPDGTIHRPLTTLELAVLQGFPAWHRPGLADELPLGAPGGQWLELTGRSNGRWRERIGNAVPPPTAQAFAEQVLRVLDSGATETFELSLGGVWCDEIHAGEDSSPRRE